MPLLAVLHGLEDRLHLRVAVRLVHFLFCCALLCHALCSGENLCLISEWAAAFFRASASVLRFVEYSLVVRLLLSSLLPGYWMLTPAPPFWTAFSAVISVDLSPELFGGFSFDGIPE